MYKYFIVYLNARGKRIERCSFCKWDSQAEFIEAFIDPGEKVLYTFKINPKQ
jgi:hypothetical protein